MKHFFTMLCAVLFCNFLNAQILVNQTIPNSGIYDYNSLYQSGDLHFYLFGDGHHSFEPDNTHEFGTNANGKTVKGYHSDPYDTDQVEELILNTVYDGFTSAAVPTYAFANKVALSRSWGLVTDNDNYFVLMFENIESKDPISGCIEFHYTNTDMDITATDILDDFDNNWVDPAEDHLLSDQQGYTHKYVWDFEDLEAGEQRFIYIPADCRADVFEIVNTRAIMKVDNCQQIIYATVDGDGANPAINNSSFYTLRSQVRNFPHDPNAIVTDPNCLLSHNELQTIRYKIYFQNDGIDPVVDVDLNFKINTPFHTIEIIESSFPCQMTWHHQTDPLAYSEGVHFLFENIYLEGSGAPDPPEYEDTYGWVTFDVCFNLKALSILGLDCVPSSVDIIFDGFPPVTAYNEICNNCGPIIAFPVVLNYYACPNILPSIQESEGPLRGLTNEKTITESDNNELVINPNPTNELLYFNAQDFAKTDLLIIKNTAGKIILSQNVQETGQSLNLSEIPSGVYYISIQNEKSVITKSFVKL